MVFRKMKIADISSLVSIYSESFDKEINYDISYRDNIYVVCLDGKVIAMCMVDYVDDVFLNEKIAYINSVCVSRNYRRRGVASFMLQELEKVIISNACNRIMLTSSDKREGAAALYNNLEFYKSDTNVYMKNL